MAEWRDVERMAGSLPEAQQLIGKDGLRSWRVRDRLFQELRELIVEAWSERAPRPFVERYEESLSEG